MFARATSPEDAHGYEVPKHMVRLVRISIRTLPHTRTTETFSNERDAKKFAKAKVAATVSVSVGTISSSAETDGRLDVDA